MLDGGSKTNYYTNRLSLFCLSFKLVNETFNFKRKIIKKSFLIISEYSRLSLSTSSRKQVSISIFISMHRKYDKGGVFLLTRGMGLSCTHPRRNHNLQYSSTTFSGQSQIISTSYFFCPVCGQPITLAKNDWAPGCYLLLFSLEIYSGFIRYSLTTYTTWELGMNFLFIFSARSFQ